MNNVLEVVVQLTVIIAAVMAGFRWGVKKLQKWLHRLVVTPMEETKKQIEPNGGSKATTRKLIEQTVVEVRNIGNTVNEMAKVDNRHETALKNLVDRFDRHLREDHGKS